MSWMSYTEAQTVKARAKRKWQFHSDCAMTLNHSTFRHHISHSLITQKLFHIEPICIFILPRSVFPSATSTRPGVAPVTYPVISRVVRWISHIMPISIPRSTIVIIVRGTIPSTWSASAGPVSVVHIRWIIVSCIFIQTSLVPVWNLFEDVLDLS